MEVIIQLEKEAADILQGHSLSDSSLTKLLSALNKRKATIRPQHSGIDDKELSQYFIVSTEDVVSAGNVGDEDFLNELLSMEYVKSAYWKPDAEPAM